MLLFLNDIENFTFESIFNDKIVDKTIYCDDISIISEVGNKCWTKNTWTFNDDNACVYFLLKKNEVVYIGQTTKSDRIKAHKENKDFDSVRFMPLKYPYNLKLESKLLSIYVTKYNKAYPSNNKHIKKLKQIQREKDIQNMYLNLY
jgi:hypothetical protein